MNPTPTKPVIEFNITYHPSEGDFTASDKLAIKEVADFYQGTVSGTSFTPGKILGVRDYTYKIIDGVFTSLRYETHIINLKIENLTDNIDDVTDFNVVVNSEILRTQTEDSVMPINAEINLSLRIQGNSSSSEPTDSLQYYKILFKAFTQVLGMDSAFYQRHGIYLTNENKDRASTRFFYGLTTQYEGINVQGLTPVTSNGKPTSEESAGARNYNKLFNDQLEAGDDIAKLARLSFFTEDILDYNFLNTCIVETQETAHDVSMPEMSQKNPRIANGLRLDIMNGESLDSEINIKYAVLSDVSFGILEDLGYAMDYSKTNNLKGIRNSYGYYKFDNTKPIEITMGIKTFDNIYSPDEFVDLAGTLTSSLSDAFERDILDIQEAANEGTITSNVETALVEKIEGYIKILANDLCGSLDLIAKSNIGSATNNPPAGLNVKYIKPSEAYTTFYLDKYETQNPYYVIKGETYEFKFKREVDAAKYNFEIGKCINGEPIGESEGVTRNTLADSSTILSFTPNDTTPRTLYFYSPNNSFTGGMITVLDAEPDTIIPNETFREDLVNEDLLDELLDCDKGISSSSTKRIYKGVPLTFNHKVNQNMKYEINKLLKMRMEYNKLSARRIFTSNFNKYKKYMDDNQDLYNIIDEHHATMMKKIKDRLINNGDRRARLI